VRFTTAAGLVNELVEAQHHNQLGRVLARWSRYELIALDVFLANFVYCRCHFDRVCLLYPLADRSIQPRGANHRKQASVLATLSAAM
jgi:hypothetical protein